MLSSTSALAKGLGLACLAAGAEGFSSPPGGRTAVGPRRSGGTALPSTLSYGGAVGHASIDFGEDAPRNMYGLEGWASQCGVQKADGVVLVPDRSGREVSAVGSSDLAAGSPVLYVPSSLILSGNAAAAELRCPEAERRLLDVGAGSEVGRWYLVLKVLKEARDGTASPWHAWLDSLPRYFSNAAAMTDFCLQCLPPLMRKLAAEERDAQRRLCDVTASVDLPFGDDYVPDPGLVKWACQVVYTRAVETPDGDIRIVPYADYFDHGSDYVEVETSFDDATGDYTAYTSYDVPAGSKLRVSYSDPRNPSRLLARWGFLDEDCPATYCKLLPPTVNQDMIDLGYSHDRMLFYKTGEVADEVWDIFLYSHLVDAGNLADRQALMAAHRAGDYNAKLALHERHYAQTSKALLDHVDNFIEDIDRLIRKAQTIGVEDPDSVYIRYEHPRLPLIHRHNLFVRDTFQSVRDRYSEDPGANWMEATRVTVQECDENECALAECVRTYDGGWECEGGLGPNPDGSERMKTQTVIAAQ